MTMLICASEKAWSVTMLFIKSMAGVASGMISINMICMPVSYCVVVLEEIQLINLGYSKCSKCADSSTLYGLFAMLAKLECL